MNGSCSLTTVKEVGLVLKSEIQNTQKPSFLCNSPRKTDRAQSTGDQSNRLCLWESITMIKVQI